MAVHRITDAPRPLREDISARSRNYIISMSIRILCFIPAIIFTGWLRWVFFAAALILPFIAVMFANEGKARQEEPLPPVTHPRRELPSEESPESSS